MAGKWMPIESSPKDGSVHLRWSERWGFVCANEPAGYYPGIWHHVKGRKWSGSSIVAAEEATHWMPLPSKPSTRATQPLPPPNEDQP